MRTGHQPSRLRTDTPWAHTGWSPRHHRTLPSGCVILTSVCLLMGASARPVAGGPLPRLAVSLPAGVSTSEIVGAMATSGVRDGVVVPPPVTARIGGEATAIEAGVPLAFPGVGENGPDLYLHLLLTLDEVPGSDREREALIEARVSEILDATSLEMRAWKGLIVEVAPGASSQRILQFAVATLIVKARAARPGLHVALMLPDDVLERFEEVSRRLVAYADSVAVHARADGGLRDVRLRELASGHPVIAKVPTPSLAGPGETNRAFLESILAAGSAAPDILWLDVAGVPALRELCASYRFLERSLGGFQATSAERVPAAVSLDGQPEVAAVGFVGTSAVDVAFLVRAGATREKPRALSVAAAGEVQVACYDALDGRRMAAPVGTKPGAGCAPDAEYVFVHVARGSGQDRVFEAVNVHGRAGLSVEEIIARWQAVREAERRALDHYSVPCLLTLHFEVTSFDVSFDVSVDLQRFVDRSGTNDWVQTGLFVNGVRFRQTDEFPLPLLEPEKVVTQPLDLAVDEKYVYRLLGTETVNGVLSYVVAIEPASPTALLYAGRVWIDGVKFRQVRMRLEQRTGQHNISSHLETQDFRTVQDADGREFTVFQRIFAEEAISVGGRAATVEKTYRFGDYAVNGPDFSTRLEAARASDRPMFRDTPEGLRSLRRQGGTRVVAPIAGRRIESWLTGTTYDASYTYPVPLFGASLVDFDFRGRGEQLSVFFAGLILAGNLSRQRGPALRTGVDLSLSALSTLDQLFVGDVAQQGSQYRTFEQSGGALVSWQPSPAWTLSAATHVAVQSFRRIEETSPAFITPSASLELREWGEIKYALRTLEASVSAEPSIRIAGFGSYGWPDQLQTPGRTYVKYQAETSKHIYLGKFTRAGVTLSYYGGIDLDRLSLYRTSVFTKPTILGVPAGVESYDAIGILSAYYGFNVLDFVNLTGSYNHVWARNFLESSRFRQFDGLTLDLGLAGPWGTFVQGTVGFTPNGTVGQYTQRWSAMVVVFKPVRR